MLRGKRGSEPRGGSVAVEGYRVGEVIGQGASATVYAAHDERFNRPVAIKVLNVGRLDAATLARFEAECRLTGAAGRHQNVVTVYDAKATSRGEPCLIMDLYEGGNLAEAVRGGALPAERVRDIGAKLADGLHLAHTSEPPILHRDIKPQNILLTKTGDVALADFGIARLANNPEWSLSREQLSPPHASPEELEGGELTARSDIYSLASTLYTLLAGTEPFGRPSTPAEFARFVRRVLSENPPPLARHDVPADLDAAIRKALAKRPEDRYPTAAAFRDALRGSSSFLTSPAATTPSPEDATLTRAHLGAAGAATAPLTDTPTPVLAPASTAIEDGTMTRASDAHIKTQPDTTPDRDEDEGTGRRWLVPAAATVALAVLAIAALSFLRGGDNEKDAGTAAVDGATTASLIDGAATTPGGAAGAALAVPTDVEVEDQGEVAVLTWSAGPAGSEYFIVEAPAEGEARIRDTVGADAGTYTLSALDPTVGYCWWLAAANSAGEDAEIVRSNPACIRDAEPA